MTKLKVCAKLHLFIIISSLLIAIGMAVGTICHFCANGFFNYGNEFSSYNCVTVTYYSSEYKDREAVEPVCEEALGGFNAYEVSFAETTLGGELVYKYSPKTDLNALAEAAETLNGKLATGNKYLSNAAVHEGVVKQGGSRAITFASIALASAAAFQFLYFIIRYKLRAAYSALLASVHNLGVFAALVAITRIPVGTETIAIGAAVVFVTMILTCLLFDRTRKNFADEKYVKTERTEVVETSASEIRMTTVYLVAALAVAALIVGVFAAISSLYIGAMAPAIVVLLGMASIFYGTVFFTPAVHSAIDLTCEKVKKSLEAAKSKKPAKKSKKSAAENVQS